jgi:glycine cleavage system P protein (glycine dehydrogenase) subunit 1
LNGGHPYIPNAAPETRRFMLEQLGIESTDELFGSIPRRLRAPDDLGLPPALPSESQLRRYFADALAGDSNTSDHLSFLGGGCWNHAVPAVCDEIASRGEFTSAFMGLGGSAATGAYQALFEYQSLMSELLGLDIAPLPSYDWAWAASTALLMATRVTERERVLLADTAGPERRRQIMARLPRRIEVKSVAHEPGSGSIDLDDLAEHAEGAAALYFENPSYLGLLEPELDAVREVTAEAGCLLVAGVDPSSLGLVRDPGSYQADLACGDLQPLGQHQTFGGTASGFMSCRLDEALLTALPNIYLAAIPTVRPGEYDYFWGNFDSTSYATRGTSDDVIGCGSTMAGIVAAVYLSLMGPVGMAELGQALRARAAYLASRLDEIPGVTTGRLTGIPFKELVVDFSKCGRSVADVDAGLLEHGIFGGISLETEFPDLAGCALYSVTEQHTREDLSRLATTLEDLLR